MLQEERAGRFWRGFQETKDLREQIQQSEKKAAEQEARLRELLTAIPNLPHASAGGADRRIDVTRKLRRWGTPPQFDFPGPPHWELGEELIVLDRRAPPNCRALASPCTGRWAAATERRRPR